MRTFILALCVAAVFSIDLSGGFNNHQQQIFAEIKQTKWGSWIVDFAQVHLDSQGPLQDLLNGIDELVADLQSELADLVKNFARRTDNHNREVIRLQQELDTASRDIFNGNDMVDNVLVPQEARLQASLDQLASNIADNRKNLDFETVQRNNENAQFQGEVSEHNEAIGAIDESLQLLSYLQHPSLIQVKKIQTNLQSLEKKLNGHSTMGPIVKALLELATESNFANPAAVQEIVTAFNNLRVELVDSLNNLVSNENATQTAFDARVVQLNAELADFQRQVLFRTAEITRTKEKLVQFEEYTAQRVADKATFTEQLQAENDSYASETDAYNNLVSQYQRELDAAAQAYQLLTQPSFTDYVNRKGGF